jgi:peptidoglycan/LPS O-acetylase OafA/YrhL
MRAGTWLLIDILILALAWRRRETPEGAFAIGACGSAAIYVMTFYFVGVATDFRYAYWAVLAAISSGIVMLSARKQNAAI